MNVDVVRWVHCCFDIQVAVDSVIGNGGYTTVLLSTILDDTELVEQIQREYKP